MRVPAKQRYWKRQLGTDMGLHFSIFASPHPLHTLPLPSQRSTDGLFCLQAGGKGSSGTQQILTMQPESLHQRTPLFLGSRDDIAELESYDGIQQTGNKKYSV